MPESAYSHDLSPEYFPEEGPSLVPRLSLELSRDIDSYESERLSDHPIEVLVTFKSSFTIPPFPTPNEREPRDSPNNQTKSTEALRLIDAIKTVRAVEYDRLTGEFSDSFDAVETERFWITSSIKALVPLRNAKRMSEHPEIQHIEYDASYSVPPSNDVIDGRARIRSDPYFPFVGGWLGLIDTGVRATHPRLANPNRFGMLLDCANGSGTYCDQGANLDPDDGCDRNHGTGAASILSANNSVPVSRGVTDILVDSLKVWGEQGNPCFGDPVSAVQRAAQAGLALLDRVIYFNLQVPGESSGSGRAAVADSVYDGGSIAVSAAGNFGPTSSSVASPGHARKVLAIGATDVVSGTLQSYSGRGPTVNGSRIKPDLVAPTNTLIASNIPSNSMFAPGGTSFSGPYAAGAAALARNWMRGASATIAPGQVNAFLIMSGNRWLFDNDWGAGLLVLPVSGHAWFGSVQVDNSGTAIELPLTPVVSPTSAISAAIWWPESASDSHKGVSLKVIRPDSTVVATSEHAWSVFQKVHVNPVIDFSGTWKLRIKGGTVGGTRTVYWAAFRYY